MSAQNCFQLQGSSMTQHLCMPALSFLSPPLQPHSCSSPEFAKSFPWMNNEQLIFTKRLSCAIRYTLRFFFLRFFLKASWKRKFPLLSDWRMLKEMSMDLDFCPPVFLKHPSPTVLHCVCHRGLLACLCFVPTKPPRNHLKELLPAAWILETLQTPWLVQTRSRLPDLVPNFPASLTHPSSAMRCIPRHVLWQEAVQHPPKVPWSCTSIFTVTIPLWGMWFPQLVSWQKPVEDPAQMSIPLRFQSTLEVTKSCL